MKMSKKMKHYTLRIFISGIVLLFIAFLLLIIPLRPSVSISEKRELTQFPKFTFAALFNGSYFSDISLWYSDTVPFRDTLTSLNAKLQNLLGTDGALAGFNEGIKGDDIPVASKPVEPESISTNQVTQPGETTQPEQNTTEGTTAVLSETTTHATLPEEEADGNFEALGSVLVYKGAGYEYYNFVQSTADSYASAVNKAAANSSCRVYNMIVPLSTAITLNTGVQKRISSDDQVKANEYLTGSMSDRVIKVNIFDTLINHRDEYIYYRTDHHWTALGAYYAYREFCKVKGIVPVSLDAMEKKSFDNFLGTFYNDSGKNSSLAANPDMVDTYLPKYNAKMTVTDSSGQTYSMPIIYDESKAPASIKYSAFISGDNPYSVIENSDLPNGESIVVVKESFGNAFVPFLISHYKTVYVVDYRYYAGGILSLAAEKGCTDILFLNNISMTRSSSLVEKLNAKLY